MVGKSGISIVRVAVHAPSARSLPLRMCEIAVGIVANVRSASPPRSPPQRARHPICSTCHCSVRTIGATGFDLLSAIAAEAGGRFLFDCSKGWAVGNCCHSPGPIRRPSRAREPRVPAAGFLTAALVCAALAGLIAGGYGASVADQLGSLRPVLVATEEFLPVIISPKAAATGIEVRRVPARFALVVANPIPAEEQLDPAEHERVLADGLRRARAGGRRHRQGGDALPARSPAPRGLGSIARGQHRGGARQRGGGGRHRGGLGGTRVILVVGDVMDDLVVRPLVPGAISITPAHGERYRGGSGANTARVAGRARRRGAFRGARRARGPAPPRAGARGLRRRRALLCWAATPTGSIVVLAHDLARCSRTASNCRLLQ